MKKIMYVLIVAFIGAVLLSGCLGVGNRLSVTGTVQEEYTYNPYGYSEPNYYKVNVVLYNAGDTPITIDKLEGVFFAGNKVYPTTVTPGELFRVLEPGKSVDFDFTTMGRTFEMQDEAKVAGKIIAFGVAIYSGESKIPVYGADLPSLEALNSTAIPLEFTRY